MRSILDLLDAIMNNPHVNTETRTRAGFLRFRLTSGMLGLKVI